MFEIREETGVELAEALADLASSLTGAPRLREAAEAAERAESLAAAMPEVPGLHAFCLDRLAWCRAQLGRPDEAVRLKRERLHARDPERFGGDLAEALRRHGDALAALGRGQAAECRDRR